MAEKEQQEKQNITKQEIGLFKGSTFTKKDLYWMALIVSLLGLQISLNNIDNSGLDYIRMAIKDQTKAIEEQTKSIEKLNALLYKQAVAKLYDDTICRAKPVYNPVKTK